MITIDYTAKNELLSPVREIYAKVELYKGSTLVATYYPTDRLIKTEVQRVGDTSKFFGFGVCQKLNVHLIDKDRELNITTANTMKISYSVNKETYIYPYPTFYISEVHRDENTNELSITAYDLLTNANKLVINDLGLAQVYNLSEFMTAASNAIKTTNVSLVNFADTTLLTTSFAQGGNLEGTEIVREILDDVAEFTQSIYYIDSNDRLAFKRLKNTEPDDLVVYKDDYFTLSSKTNRRLVAICRATELGDNITASVPNQSGTTQYLRDNVFYDVLNGTQIAELLDDALALMGGLTVNQFDCSWRGNFFLEIGDKVGFIGKNNALVHSYILDDTVTYDGSFYEQSRWEYTSSEEESPSNPTTIGDKLNQTFARVDKINKEIELLVSDMEEIDVDGIKTLQTDVSRLKIDLTTIAQEVRSNKTTIDGDITKIEEDIASLVLTNDSITQRVSALEQNEGNDEEVDQLKEEVAELKITTQGITQEVSRVEQETGESIRTLTEAVSSSVTAEDVKILIKQEVTEGIDVGATSVTTTTGYLFNKEGLTVSKTGSDITTQITEDGMTVRRNSETVLSADSEGVYATNLHATTYLIVGETSRFEDYDGDSGARTGCFWVGR